MQPPIGDYALIGDCHSAALVSKKGAIDWACLSRFDSGAAFARILDWKKGGTFCISPHARARVERRYLPGTNVLETTFITATGRAKVLDCFSMRKGGGERPDGQLLRIVVGISGRVHFDIVIQPRFDYGALKPWIRFHADERVYSAVGGSDAVVLSTDCDLDLDRQAATLTGSFTVAKGQRRRFSLLACEPQNMPLVHMPARLLDTRLKSTIDWWKAWTAAGNSREPYREAVERSALVLKMLTCAPTGAIIAAPTTSLPEIIGGSRNLDYRYSWIRDSTMTLAALLNAGHPEVAAGFKLFIERATAGTADDLQIMYGCYGERRLPEITLDHLSGYRQSQPVRIGNGAACQTQLDVFGELLDAAHLWRRAGNAVDEDSWRFLRSLVDAVCEKWRKPDRGLWEIRGRARHFVHSKVMCWVALERGIQAAAETKHTCNLKSWTQNRDELRAVIEKKGFDAARGCFVQSFGSKEVDASLLLLPIVGFIDARDPRMMRTVAAIRKDLAVHGLLRRYRPQKMDDGLAQGEGAFLMASFWLVDVLAMQGEVKGATALFRRLLAMANDVGLYSEEYDARRKQLLGNFPQAFTHMAVINAAEQLRRAETGDDHRKPIADRAHGRRSAAR